MRLEGISNECPPPTHLKYNEHNKQLHGQCRDASCPDVHLDSPPTASIDTAPQPAPAPTAVAQRAALHAEGVVAGGEGGSACSKGLPQSQTLVEMRGDGGKQDTQGGGGVQDGVADSVAAMDSDPHLRGGWGDFMAFSPLPKHLKQIVTRHLSQAVSPVSASKRYLAKHLTASEVASDAASDAVPDTPRAKLRRVVEEEVAAEEEGVTRLEKEWRVPTEEVSMI